MNYDEMSDRAIDHKIVGVLYGHNDKDINKFFHRGRFNYCNNPSDAWPIILSYCMDVELSHPELGDIGTCTIYNPMGTDWQCDFTDNNKALRAAMICFLKMKDAEND